MQKGLLICIILYFLGQLLGYFQSNGILMTDWLKNNAWLTCLILGPLTALCFTYGTYYLYQDLQDVYASRFIAFSIGYLIFIPLTWYFFGESPFTLKNMLSLVLCITLISIQAFMK